MKCWNLTEEEKNYIRSIADWFLRQKRGQWFKIADLTNEPDKFIEGLKSAAVAYDLQLTFNGSYTEFTNE